MTLEQTIGGLVVIFAVVMVILLLTGVFKSKTVEADTDVPIGGRCMHGSDCSSGHCCGAILPIPGSVQSLLNSRPGKCCAASASPAASPS